MFDQVILQPIAEVGPGKVCGAEFSSLALVLIILPAW